MPRIQEIRQTLRTYTPRLVSEPSNNRAAVAVVLREAAGRVPELLFIERAHSAHDPWSGHMAFPGGHVDPCDPSPQAAAERETLEEVGLSLAWAEHLARLDDLEGRHAGRPSQLVISAFVYFCPQPGPLRANQEVAQMLWIPLSALSDPARHVERSFSGAGPASYPGIVVGDPDRHVVWGLTYRFLEIFFEALCRPLPRPASRAWLPEP